jgi:hypothetical protein
MGNRRELLSEPKEEDYTMESSDNILFAGKSSDDIKEIPKQLHTRLKVIRFNLNFWRSIFLSKLY